MSKRRNLKKEKQERNRAYARKFKKRKLRTDGRPEGMNNVTGTCLLYTSPSPRDATLSRMPSSA